MLIGQKRDMSELKSVCPVSMTGLHMKFILSPDKGSSAFFNNKVVHRPKMCHIPKSVSWIESQA